MEIETNAVTEKPNVTEMWTMGMEKGIGFRFLFKTRYGVDKVGWKRGSEQETRKRNMFRHNLEKKGKWIGRVIRGKEILHGMRKEERK